MKLEISIAEEISDIETSHFLLYHDHLKHSDWFYEYENLMDATKNGESVADIIDAIRDKRVIVTKEVETWD